MRLSNIQKRYRPASETTTFDNSTWSTVISPSGGLCNPSGSQAIPNSTALPVWGRNPQQRQIIYARKTFSLQNAVSATIKTLVDDDFDLYVNGVHVKSDWNNWTDYFDNISVQLVSGVNSIAIKASDTFGSCQSLAFDVAFDITSYSITGRVMDGSNNSIAGVSISDGVGHTVMTDSSGSYTLSGLAAGSYTITPSKSGYTLIHQIAHTPIYSPIKRTKTI